MKIKRYGSIIFLAAMTLFIMATNQMVFSQSNLDCKLCHNSIYQQWLAGSHSDTQMDVAGELAEERTGQSPDTVLYGSDAENCIACHGALAVTKNGGMTEAEALAHFFTTTNGVFTESTTAADTANWPHTYCTTCHNVPTDHPASMPVFGYFNSTTTNYDDIGKVATLCGRCHGNIRFEGTDHLTYNAWDMSKHSLTQDDVADELAEERTGESPDSVIAGSDPENCIACHGPTAVLANGEMSEVEALDYFFSTENGVFSSNTVSLHKDEWPDVSCISCHNPHTPNEVSYFNSSTKEYETMDSADKLCGQCHGNLRFPDTDHLSYNILKGIGASGVQFSETMSGVTCTDCHMYASDVEESNSTMYHGHSWSIFVAEENGSETVSCQACHQDKDATVSRSDIQTYQDETEARLDSAEQKFALAASQMEGNTDATLQAKLAEAETNLALVEGDESGGFHNHKYQMDLLANVIQNANDILAATGVQEYGVKNPRTFSLFQNYPNPFNPTTKIAYVLPERTQVTLEIFNLLGEKVRTLVNSQQNAGEHSVVWDARNDVGKEVPNGIYIYRITAAEYKSIRKMTLLK
ncbi:MAG: ammonia-forming cytochrome c nitrite reductase subunit c552 [Calditrichaeota bacterium]|nr:ammonia-forming cytochrome c nitrite reductase subunit c552 [Calditrichota bacterium]